MTSLPLFEELALKPGDTFPLRSSRYDENGITYQMVVTPEGYVVHDGLGCEGEQFSGVRGCYHSKESEKYVTNSLVPYEAMVPQRIEFSNDQLDTIAKVICVDTEGRVAPPAFVQLFVAACRHTGLDPFLRQIYALSIRGKWTMFVGIDGYRVISERTGLDQGMDGPQWSDDGQNWYDFPFSDSPAFCRVGIWRKDVPRAFVAVCSMKAKINPNSDSWKKDAAGMLAKCAEALARRRAFPADMAVIPNEAVFDNEDEPRWSVSDAPPQSLAERTGHEAFEGEVVKHETPRGSKFSPNAVREVDTETGEIHEDPQEAEAQPQNAAATGAPSAPPAPSPRREAVQAPTRPRPAPPAPAPRPDGDPDPGAVADPALQVILEWWAETRRLGIDRNVVIAKSLELFNKEPQKASAEEREQLMQALTAAGATEAEAAQAGLPA